MTSTKYFYLLFLVHCTNPTNFAVLASYSFKLLYSSSSDWQPSFLDFVDVAKFETLHKTTIKKKLHRLKSVALSHHFLK